MAFTPASPKSWVLATQFLFGACQRRHFSRGAPRLHQPSTGQRLLGGTACKRPPKVLYVDTFTIPKPISSFKTSIAFASS
jgi:hypothetical protein